MDGQVQGQGSTSHDSPGHQVIDNVFSDHSITDHQEHPWGNVQFLDQCSESTRILCVSLMHTAASSGAAIGSLWAIVGGATAVLADATRDTRIVAETAGQYRFDLRSHYNVTGLNLPERTVSVGPAALTLPVLNTIQQSPQSGTLCAATVEGEFPIADGGGLGLVEDNLGWSLASVFVGQALEMTCSRLSHYIVAKQLNHLVDRGLSEYFMKLQSPDYQALPRSCAAQLAASLGVVMKRLCDLTSGLDGLGSLAFFTGMGLRMLQEGMPGTPYSGLNDMTLASAREQPIDVDIPYIPCEQSDLLFQKSGISGHAFGRLAFPEIFTQQLNANQIIGGLILAGIAAKILSAFAAQWVTARVIPSQIQRILFDQVEGAAVDQLGAHRWLAQNKDQVAEEVCFQLAAEGVLEGQHVNYLKRHISDRLAQGANPADFQPNTSCCNRLLSIRQAVPSLDRVMSVGRMMVNTTAVLPVRPVEPLSKTLIFFSDLSSKLGTVALLSAYIAQTISDGIPPVSRGFDGVPAGAASEFPFVISAANDENLQINAKGAVMIPNFSLQDIHTNWFIPLITAGVSAKLIHVASLQLFRQAQTFRVCQETRARWETSPPANAQTLSNENRKMTLALLGCGAITDGAFRGSMASITRLPCVGWLGEEPFEIKSLRLLNRDLQYATSIENEQYSGKNLRQCAKGMGYFIAHMLRDFLSVGAGYAIGLALIGKVFEQWTTQGKISALDPAGAQLNLTGQFHVESQSAQQGLEQSLWVMVSQDISQQIMENLSLVWRNPGDGIVRSVECALNQFLSHCTAMFKLESERVEEPLSVYEIPNPSTITDVIWRFGLMIGIPVLALTLWAHAKMGALGVGSAYEGIHPRSARPESV